MGNNQPFKRGEKIMFGIFGAFIVFSVVVYIALEAVRMHRDKPMYSVTTHYDLSKEGAKGSALFRTGRCTACHRAMRNGTNMGLDLDGIGSRRAPEWIQNFLVRPEETYGSVTLDHGDAPKEASYVAALPAADLHAIGVFLSELKADQGSSAAEAPPPGRSSFIDNMVEMWAPQGWKNKYQDVRTKGQQPAEPAGGGE